MPYLEHVGVKITTAVITGLDLRVTGAQDATAESLIREEY